MTKDDVNSPTDAELWQLHMQMPGVHKNPIDFARAVLAKWGTPPAAPAQAADSVLEDAARWQMAVLVGNEVMLHPDKRSNPAAVKAYMDAVHSGLDLTGAIDAARKQGANLD